MKTKKEKKLTKVEHAIITVTCPRLFSFCLLLDLPGDSFLKTISTVILNTGSNFILCFPYNVNTVSHWVILLRNQTRNDINCVLILFVFF